MSLDTILRAVIDGIRAANPSALVVYSGQQARELMQLRVWLDDVRPMPKEGFDVHVKTAAEAIALIESGEVTFMSFDHDLGFDKTTMSCAANSPSGYEVAKVAERLAYEGKIPAFGWAVHSMNPTGAAHIEMAFRNADRYWSAEVTA